MKQRLRTVAVLVVVSAVLHARLALAQSAPSARMTVLPDRPDGIYQVGDTVHWTVKWTGGDKPPAGARYTLKSGGLKDVGNGELTFTDNTATFDSKLDAP